MIYIQYFGPLATELGTRAETLPWNNGGTTETLLSVLRSRNKRWKKALATDKIFKLVVEKKICHELVDIPDGAVVAILPPVTGG
jgi:sulfur-carrier protein